MYLIVGLGNPGKEYEKTRHNAGFLIVDELGVKWNFPEFKEKKEFKAEISEEEMDGNKIMLTKPTTFMNLSGEAVEKIASFYKIPPENIIVIYDELDLPLGEIKWRHSNDTGSGGHNGIKSIIEHLGTMNFPRLKIGISSPERPEQMSGSDYVLSKFNQQEIKDLQSNTDKIIEKIQSYIFK